MSCSSISRDKKLVVDVMGSDLGPSEVIAGVALALTNLTCLDELNLSLVLVGDEDCILPLLDAHGLKGHERLSIVHATEIIGMDEKPVQSLKQKKDSSMIRALELVKDNKAEAVLSCGNTGSLMAGGTIKLRPILGVDRPALASIIPSCDDHHFVLLDVGANPTPTAEQMVHNSVLGSNYYKAMFDIERPRVGLLTIGTEEGKGIELTHDTHALLKKLGDLINYTGLIEGFQVFNNEVDVVVCDGFVGNILLKSCESLLRSIQSIIKKELSQNLLRKFAALIARGAYTSIKSRFDPDEHGSVPLLGLNGLVLKAHGSSNRFAIKNSIKAACVIIQHEMHESNQKSIAKANELIRGEKLSED